MLKVGYLILALLVVAALLMWPQPMGGEVAYVTYNQPDIGSGVESGDIAAVRRAREYKAGDLVAVKTTDGPPIFGWVVGKQGNDWLVNFRARSEPVAVGQQFVLGRLWINLGDVSRGAIGSVFRAVGIQLATSP